MNNSNAKHSGQKSTEPTSEVTDSNEEYTQQVNAARELVEKWAAAGPALEELRFRQLQELDDETARKMMLDLFAMWRPSHFDDLGSGLVEQQRIFAKLRERESERGRAQ